MPTAISRIRARLTYANVVATLALFVALCGTAYAAATIGSSQIIDNSILGRDIANGTVTDSDIKSSAVIGGDIANGTVTGSDVDESSLVGIDAETFDGLDSTQFGGGNALRWSFGMSYGDPNETIGTLGPLTFEAVCADLGGANQTAATRVSTSVDDMNVNGALWDIVDSPIIVSSVVGGVEAADVEQLYVRDPSEAVGINDATVSSAVHSDGADCWFDGNVENLVG